MNKKEENQSSVRVRPLEWKRYDDGWWEASSVFGDYLVRESWRDWLAPDATWVDESDVEAAKAAAQSHYEAAILSALLPAPQPLPLAIERDDRAEVEAAMEAFWNAAYQQGVEGRDHDDLDGSAQKAEDDLRKAIKAFANQ